MLKQRLIMSMLILLCMGASQHLYAQQYLVFSVTGKVERVTKQGKVALKADEVLQPSDVISIPYGGGVTLIDKASKTMYKQTKSGQGSVGTLIKNGHASVSKLTLQYLNYVLAQVRGGNNGVKRNSDPATVTRDKKEVEKPDDFTSAYEQFRKQAKGDYEEFRAEANRKYSDFMKEAWKSYKKMPAIPQPKDEDVKPVVVPKEEENKKPIETKPLPIKEEVVTPPVVEPQPKPVAPIREQPKPEEKYVSFTFYGTELRIRFNDEERFRLEDLKNNTLATMWKTLSDGRCDNTIRDCLEYRITLQLSDWGYLMMLKDMAEACLGKGNEAQLLLAYVYCQSGYKMRLAKDDGNLYVFYASKHHIYNKYYYEIDGNCIYALTDKDVTDVEFCDVAFPKEQPLSLYISQQPQLAYNMSDSRTLKSRRYDDIKVTTSVNKNLIDFYNSYPASEVNDNFMTRWQMYANTPMAKEVTDNLYPVLRKKLEGQSQLEAVERLLNWVQTAFVYEYDEKVWGGDRAFFAEESLYYPYCDCEDRSILFSHLVRDLLGLKVVLVYYPGHLATAVCFTDEVKGDYIPLNGRRYVICDGTYIGAPVGRTMPDMDNKTAMVILLD